MATLAKPRIDMDAIAAAVSADIATRYGHSVGSKPVHVDFGEKATVAYVEIEMSFGIFSMGVDHAHLRLRAVELDGGTIRVDVEIQHMNGSQATRTYAGAWFIRADGVVEYSRQG